MTLKEMILRLSEAPGPSGREDAAMAVAAELLRPYVDELRRDAMGNLICLKRGKIYGKII